MSKIDWEKMSNDFREVQEKCEAWVNDIRGMEDGGTCNLDSVILNCKGIREPRIKAFNENSKIKIGYKHEGFWKAYRYLNFTTWGQGNLRTEMVQFISEALKTKGYDVSVYYHMD